MGNSTSTSSLKPKTKYFKEEYRISDKVLGEGVNGKVFQCIRKSDNKLCALKILSESAKSRREVDLHARALACPHIVQVLDVFENTINGKPSLLLVMECMSGGELFSRIEGRENAFTEREAADIVRGIVAALAFLHRHNVAHRDLKPENLLYSDPGPNGVLKLTDFGFAKEVGRSKTLQTPVFTPYYA